MKRSGIVYRSRVDVGPEPDLLASVRELYSRRPETCFLEAWEMQHVLFSLGYTDDLADEVKIDAGIKISRTDCMPDEGAA